MIILNMENFSWGTAPVPGYDNARRLNFLDDDSTIRFTMVFSDAPLGTLIEELIPGLTPEQAADLIPKLEAQTVTVPGEAEAIDTEAAEE